MNLQFCLMFTIKISELYLYPVPTQNSQVISITVFIFNMNKYQSRTKRVKNAGMFDTSTSFHMRKFLSAIYYQPALYNRTGRCVSLARTGLERDARAREGRTVLH